jgi:hypothetical protein
MATAAVWGELGMIDISISEGDVLVGIESKGPLGGLQRVVQVIRKLDRAVLIPIPSPRHSSHAKQANYYAKGFHTEKLSQLRLLLETKAIRKTELALPHHWYMSDAELRKLSPPTGLKKVPLEERHLSPLERKRNFKYMLIAPLIAIAEKTVPTKLPDLSCLDALVKERAREVGVSAGQVFDALHRYYAFGSVLNALLPNNAGRSGAPERKRRAKNGVKLGRKNAAVKAGRTDQAGLVLTDQDVENMQDGYSAFVRPGTTIRDAFPCVAWSMLSIDALMRISFHY